MIKPLHHRHLPPFIKKNLTIIYMICIFSMLPIIYWVVYATGGIKYVYSHSMYIAILLAGILVGPKFGVFIALTAAILLGPLMPIDTLTGEMQEPQNYIYRGIIFILVGWISGYAFHQLKTSKHHIKELMSMNQETHIPNTNALSNIQECLIEQPYTLITILINNHHNIIDVMGTYTYHQLIHQIYIDIKYEFNACCQIIQADSNKLWVILKHDDLTKDTHNVLNVLSKQRVIQNIPLYVDFSLGVCFAPAGKRIDELSIFEHSDNAARYAQIDNLIYSIHDDKYIQKKADYTLLTTFSKALEEDQTFLVFQPKIDIETAKPIGFEALIRWNHPTHGIIAPIQFVPLVEETKLIHPMTDWVLRKTIDQIFILMKCGISLPISINISVKNLFDPNFYKRVMSIIETYDVPKNLIHFEITESVLMTNPEEGRKILESFVKQGILIELDDFGSGYSSLAYLSQFPISTIKIDRSFLQTIQSNSSVREIVKASIQLSKNLGYKVVAEGVESKAVEAILKDLECEYAQGYYYAKPMKSDQLLEWCNHQTHQKGDHL